LQIHSEVEDQINKGARDHCGFEYSQTSMRQYERKKQQRQRGDVKPDSQHFCSAFDNAQTKFVIACIVSASFVQQKF